MHTKDLWKLAKENLLKEREELPDEEGDAVGEQKLCMRKTSGATGKREDEKSKDESEAEAEGKGEEGEKRKREEEKEENETRTVKRRCEVLCLWKPLKFFVKKEMWRVAEMFPGNTSWRSLRTCLVVSLFLVRRCVLCLM